MDPVAEGVDPVAAGVDLARSSGGGAVEILQAAANINGWHPRLRRRAELGLLPWRRRPRSRPGWATSFCFFLFFYFD